MKDALFFVLQLTVTTSNSMAMVSPMKIIWGGDGASLLSNKNPVSPF